MRHEGPVHAVAFSPDGKTVLTGSDDQTARLWDATTGEPIGLPMVHEARVISVAFNPVDETSPDRHARTGRRRFWDAATGRPIGQPLTHQKRIEVVSSAPTARPSSPAARTGRRGSGMPKPIAPSANL